MSFSVFALLFFGVGLVVEWRIAGCVEALLFQGFEEAERGEELVIRNTSPSSNLFGVVPITQRNLTGGWMCPDALWWAPGSDLGLATNR